MTRQTKKEISHSRRSLFFTVFPSVTPPSPRPTRKRKKEHPRRRCVSLKNPPKSAHKKNTIHVSSLNFYTYKTKCVLCFMGAVLEKKIYPPPHTPRTYHVRVVATRWREARQFFFCGGGKSKAGLSQVRIHVKNKNNTKAVTHGFINSIISLHGSSLYNMVANKKKYNHFTIFFFSSLDKQKIVTYFIFVYGKKNSSANR